MSSFFLWPLLLITPAIMITLIIIGIACVLLSLTLLIIRVCFNKQKHPKSIVAFIIMLFIIGAAYLALFI